MKARRTKDAPGGAMSSDGSGNAHLALSTGLLRGRAQREGHCHRRIDQNREAASLASAPVTAADRMGEVQDCQCGDCHAAMP